jgi:nucleotide-binding universal stress UspA family protein
VLIVPENCPYTAYRKILYALSYEEQGLLALDALYAFAQPFDAQITFLHVSKEDTDVSRTIFNATKTEIEVGFEGKLKPVFNRTIVKDPSDGIGDFIRENPTDLLVMVARHRNIIERIFRKRPLLDSISSTSSCPVLVLYA